MTTPTTTPSPPFAAVTVKQGGTDPVQPALTIIIAVVIVGSLVLLVLSVLIFLAICYLRSRMRDMNTTQASYDLGSAESSESPPPKKRSDVEDGKRLSRLENGNAGTTAPMHFSTLPPPAKVPTHRQNGVGGMAHAGEGGEEEERYQSLPMLAVGRERTERRSLPLSELGTRC